MPAEVRKGRFQRISSKRGVEIPLQTMKHSHRIDPEERVFLDAVEKGDKPTVIKCLTGSSPVSVNCTDMLGRSAMQIAVDNENSEIVELLLKQEGVEIGDALLYAIREGVYRIVEMLIEHPSTSRDMLGSDWAKKRNLGEESFDYSPDISPVILAAHCNQFEILQLLILKGANIDQPHQLSCSCKRCQARVNADSLRHSLLRINTYRALASPAWISLTSPDPVLTAFTLSWELDRLALRENEFKDSYLQLGQQCKKYACDLLNQCRSSEEVVAVLNKANDFDDAALNDPWGNKLTLARLKLAIKYEQKQFVAHPHCQQLLTSIWYDGLPGWRKRNGVTKFVICLSLIIFLPLIALFYLIFPRSKIGVLLRSPFMKFLYHSASFGTFLFLLVCASTDVMHMTPKRERLRGPMPSELEWLIVLWVTGFVWAECKQLWEEGLKTYIRQWWNWLDFIMLSLYLATFSLRLVAYFQIESGLYGEREMFRKYWPHNDPTLIAEGLFAVANVFSFARIIYLFQANQHLGPLQISLGCMFIDIAKFLFIFFLVLSSFACGLNQLYWYYYSEDHTNKEDLFSTLFSSYVTLFWSMFSLTPPSKLDVHNTQRFTRMVGELLFMAYHAMAVIVLLNMLIAMMSSSFQDIENHADMEWKFARSKLWMGYFDEGSTLPTPFNLIVSPKSIYYFFVWLRESICKCTVKGRRTYDVNQQHPTEPTNESPKTATKVQCNEIFKTAESGDLQNNNKECHNSGEANGFGINQEPESRPVDEALQYQEVMRRLICRYIHQTKKQHRQDGVNEDDLLEIKQDISSLRYELREDRKSEMLRTSSHMNNLRQDLHHTISTLSPEVPVMSPLNSPSLSPLVMSRGDQGEQTQFNFNVQYASPTVENRFVTSQLFPSQSTPSLCSCISFQSDVDRLKRELAMTVRREINDVLRSPLSSTERLCGSSGIQPLNVAMLEHPPPTPSHSTIVIPSTGAELYHTHLYTQL